MVLSPSFTGMPRVAKNLSHPTCMFQAEVKQDNALPSHFSSHSLNNCLLGSILCAKFFAFFCYIQVTSSFKMAPSIGLKVVMYLMEKTQVLDKLPSSVSYSVLGHDFHINELAVYIKQNVFKWKHKQGYVLIG